MCRDTGEPFAVKTEGRLGTVSGPLELKWAPGGQVEGVFGEAGMWDRRQWGLCWEQERCGLVLVLELPKFGEYKLV